MPSFYIPSEFVFSKIDLEKDTRKTIAEIIRTVLFEGEIVLLDTDWVNTFLFRKAFENHLIQDLIKYKKIKIATQFVDNKYISLKETADNTLETKSYSPHFPDLDIYKDYSLVNYSDKFADKIPYTKSEFNKHYNELLYSSASNFSYEEFEGGIPESIRKVIVDIFNERIADVGYLSAGFVQREHGIGIQLAKRLNTNSAWQQYGGFIWSLSVSSYYSFLPNKLGTSPVYGQDLARAFDIWRRVEIAKNEKLVETSKIKSDISPSSFRDGLLQLEIGDILALVERDEAKAYINSIKSFAYDEQSIIEVKKAYLEYKRVIDSLLLYKFKLIQKEEYFERVDFYGVNKANARVKYLSKTTLFTIIDSLFYNSATVINSLIDIARIKTKKDEQIEHKMEELNFVNQMAEVLKENPNSESEIITDLTHFRQGISDTLLTSRMEKF